MKKILLLLALAQSLAAHGATSRLTAEVERWLRAQATVTNWCADFEQTRKLKSLTQPLTAKGRVWFSAPQSFRWELGEQTIAVRAEDNVLVIYPKLKRVERYSTRVEDAGPWGDVMALMEAGFPRTEDQLLEKFEVVSQKMTGQSVELELEPRSTAARKVMPRMRLTFDLQGASLRSTELQFADGSTMRNDFLNPKLNTAMDRALFAPVIPPEYKVAEPLKKR